MKTEIEAKFLNIDPVGIREKLAALGASMVYAEHTVRQKVFDYPDLRLDGASSWLRLREENNVIVLTLKKWEKEGVDGMKEIELHADSFEETQRLLLGIGMMVKSSQEKKRELWRWENVEFMIDTWPWIPRFIEIEGPSEAAVRHAADQLGLGWIDAIFGGVARIYQKYFDVQLPEIDRCPEITFSAVPEWLEKKRIR